MLEEGRGLFLQRELLLDVHEGAQHGEAEGQVAHVDGLAELDAAVRVVFSELLQSLLVEELLVSCLLDWVLEAGVVGGLGALQEAEVGGVSCGLGQLELGLVEECRVVLVHLVALLAQVGGPLLGESLLVVLLGQVDLAELLQVLLCRVEEADQILLLLVHVLVPDADGRRGERLGVSVDGQLDEVEEEPVEVEALVLVLAAESLRVHQPDERLVLVQGNQRVELEVLDHLLQLARRNRVALPLDLVEALHARVHDHLVEACGRGSAGERGA